MKIIAKADNDQFIVTMHKDEAYRLVGYYYAGDDKAPKLDIGSDIKVSEMFMSMFKRKHFESDVDEVVRRLESMIEAVKLVKPVD